MTTTTRYIVAVVPFGETQTDTQQLETLARLGIPTERQTIGVWGDDAPERGFWTTDERLAFILAKHLDQKAVWRCEFDYEAYKVEGFVIHLAAYAEDNANYFTEGALKHYNDLDQPDTNYTYFLGDRVSVG